MFRQKRGAVELSITTIVVVVIGITLLTLGLSWVTGIFDKLDVTTEGAFEQADTQIDEILGGGTGKLISLSPSTLTLKKGGTANTKVIIENTEETTYSSITLTVLDDPTDPNEAHCYFAENGLTTISIDPIDSGYQAEVVVLVKDNGAATKTYTCSFTVDVVTVGTPEKNAILLINVVK